VRDKVEKIDKLYQKNENQTKKQVEDLFTSIYNLFLFLGTNGNNKTRSTSKYKINMRLSINC
jgi:signal recognition particle GTPase